MVFGTLQWCEAESEIRKQRGHRGKTRTYPTKQQNHRPRPGSYKKSLKSMEKEVKGVWDDLNCEDKTKKNGFLRAEEGVVEATGDLHRGRIHPVVTQEGEKSLESIRIQRSPPC